MGKATEDAVAGKLATIPGTIVDGDISADGRWLAVVSLSIENKSGKKTEVRAIYLFDLSRQGEKLEPIQLSQANGNPESVRFGGAGRWLISHGKVNTVLWDLRATDIAQSARAVPLRNSPRAVVTSDDRWLAGWTAGNQSATDLLLYNLSADDPQKDTYRMLGTLGPQGGLHISSDGRWLAVPYANEAKRGIRLLRLSGASPDGKVAQATAAALESRAQSIEIADAATVQVKGFSDDGNWLLVQSTVNSDESEVNVQLYRLNSQTPASSCVQLPKSIIGLIAFEFSPQGRWLYVVYPVLSDEGGDKDSAPSELRRFNLAARDVVESMVVVGKHPRRARCVLSNAKEGWVATGCDDGIVRVWSTSNKGEVSPLVALQQRGIVTDSYRVPSASELVAKSYSPPTEAKVDVKTKPDAASAPKDGAPPGFASYFLWFVAKPAPMIHADDKFDEAPQPIVQPGTAVELVRRLTAAEIRPAPRFGGRGPRDSKFLQFELVEPNLAEIRTARRQPESGEPVAPISGGFPKPVSLILGTLREKWALAQRCNVLQAGSVVIRNTTNGPPELWELPANPIPIEPQAISRRGTDAVAGPSFSNCHFSPDGRWFATTGIGGTIRLSRWNGPSEPVELSAGVQTIEAPQVAFSRGGNYLASLTKIAPYGERHAAVVWRLSDDALPREVYRLETRPFPNMQHPILFSQDERWLIIGSENGLTGPKTAGSFVSLIDLADSAPLRTLQQLVIGYQAIRGVDISPNGRWILAASLDGTFAWELPAKGPVRAAMRLPNRSGVNPYMCAFHATNRSASVIDYAGKMSTWDFSGTDPRPQPLFETPGRGSGDSLPPATSASRNRKWLAVANSDKELCVWDLTKEPSETPRYKLLGQDGRIHNMAFSHDESMLAALVWTLGNRPIVALWTLGTDHPDETLIKLANPNFVQYDPRIPPSLAFTPDGRFLLVSNQDKTLVHRLKTDDLVFAAQNVAGRSLTPEERAIDALPPSSPDDVPLRVASVPSLLRNQLGASIATTVPAAPSALPGGAGALVSSGPVTKIRSARRWVGRWRNTLGESGEDALEFTELDDGTLTGFWTGEVAIKGQRHGNATWTMTGVTTSRSYKISVFENGGSLYLSYEATRLDAPGTYSGTSVLQPAK